MNVSKQDVHKIQYMYLKYYLLCFRGGTYADPPGPDLTPPVSYATDALRCAVLSYMSRTRVAGKGATHRVAQRGSMTCAGPVVPTPVLGRIRDTCSRGNVQANSRSKLLEQPHLFTHSTMFLKAHPITTLILAVTIPIGGEICAR